MTGTKRFVLIVGVAVASLVVAAAVSAQSEAHGRVSFADEKGLIKGQQDTDWSYAALNSLVMPGDQIWADDSSALELEFEGGTFVRLADGSRLDVIDVPPNGIFRGVLGSFYVQRVSRSNGDVRVETPVGTLTIEPDSQVRIDVLEGGATTVSVRWGRVFIVATGESNSIPVNAGMRTFVDPGYLPSEPVAFDRNEEDSFDSWNRDRARYIAEGSGPAPVDYGSNAPVGVSELNNYGEWVYIDDTPYWRPTVAVNYVPYRYGYWSYVPYHGYVWCDNYPFAYVTSHYGHWRHHPSYGWCWRYAGYYRPAYAYTLSYGDYFVWAPLGYDGYPCYSSLYAGFAIGGIHFSYGFSSFAYHYDVFHCYPRVFPVHHHHIFDKHHHHHHKDSHYWRIEADSRPYDGAGRPHWPGDSPRTYQPAQVLRGGATLASDGGRTPAPERARQLEARRPSRTGTPVQPGSIARPTPNDRSERTAAVRQARVDSPSSSRMARAADPNARTGGSSRTRTYSNEEARGADPLSRGSLGSRPTNPAERRSLTVSPNGRIESPEENNESGDRPSRPAEVGGRSRTVDQPSRGNSIERPTRPTTASTGRPQVIRPDDVTTQRPEVERPSTSSRPVIRPEPSRPSSPSEPRPTAHSRPEVDRPQRPESTSLPTRPQVESPQRPSPSRVDVQQRPQVIRTERPTAAPESTRRQVTTTGVDRRETPAPQRQTVSRSIRTDGPSQAQRSAPSSRSFEPSPSRPQKPSFAAPERPSNSSQRFSSPSRSQLSGPQVSSPSRPSSPQMSTPSRSSGSSRSFSSGGSSHSSSGGSSRSIGGGPSRSPR